MTTSKQAKGHQFKAEKLTKGCHKVIQAMEKIDGLNSAQDIYGCLRQDEPDAPGLTTVYRSLESLVGLGLVQAVDFGDGEKRYELVEPGEHHHHLVCQRCKRSVHLDMCLVEELEEGVRKKYGFEVRSHILEIFGICKQCLSLKSKS